MKTRRALYIGELEARQRQLEFVLTQEEKTYIRNRIADLNAWIDEIDDKVVGFGLAEEVEAYSQHDFLR